MMPGPLIALLIVAEEMTFAVQGDGQDIADMLAGKVPKRPMASPFISKLITIWPVCGSVPTLI